MCGIVGFTGRREASPVLLEGLRRLEYRGYDSAGLITSTGNELHLRKKAGRLAELRSARFVAPGARAATASATRAGPRTAAAHRPQPHPHMNAARRHRRSFTTASSKTTRA